jgi:hypothetical protein
MLLFRSGEHVVAWVEARGGAIGATLTPGQGWELARAWFRDRLSEEWRRSTTREAQALFDRIGLVGPFWRLADDVSSPPPTETPGA